MAKLLDSFPDPEIDAAGSGAIVLAGGCFWCTEGVFRAMPGVTSVTSGYAGGDKSTASYRLVGEGDTGHAEVIEIKYDPTKVTLGQILKTFFWLAHDPTQADGQGANRGSQYRSAIFYADETQRDVAAKYIAQLNAAQVFEKPIATTLEPLKAFYKAEAEHQDFVSRNPHVGYVRVVSQPKIDKAKKAFSQ